MTPEERQALRKKHRNLMGECFECYRMINAKRLDISQPPEYTNQSWPCDLIQVLDATEQTYKRGYNDGWENCNEQWKER